VPSLLSLEGGRGGAVSEAMPLMRRFKALVALCATHDLHAASPHQLRPRHVFVASASSHGPLTACVEACHWRPQ
jgi:hypothetical protein